MQYPCKASPVFGTLPRMRTLRRLLVALAAAAAIPISSARAFHYVTNDVTVTPSEWTPDFTNFSLTWSGYADQVLNCTLAESYSNVALRLSYPQYGSNFLTVYDATTNDVFFYALSRTNIPPARTYWAEFLGYDEAFTSGPVRVLAAGKVTVLWSLYENTNAAAWTNGLLASEPSTTQTVSDTFSATFSYFTNSQALSASDWTGEYTNFSWAWSAFDDVVLALALDPVVSNAAVRLCYPTKGTVYMDIYGATADGTNWTYNISRTNMPPPNPYYVEVLGFEPNVTNVPTRIYGCGMLTVNWSVYQSTNQASWTNPLAGTIIGPPFHTLSPVTNWPFWVSGTAGDGSSLTGITATGTGTIDMVARADVAALSNEFVTLSNEFETATGDLWTAVSAVPTGTLDHASLSNLAWTVSGHTGAADSVACFAGDGSASTLPTSTWWTVGAALTNATDEQGRAWFASLSNDFLTATNLLTTGKLDVSEFNVFSNAYVTFTNWATTGTVSLAAYLAATGDLWTAINAAITNEPLWEAASNLVWYKGDTVTNATDEELRAVSNYWWDGYHTATNNEAEIIIHGVMDLQANDIHGWTDASNALRGEVTAEIGASNFMTRIVDAADYSEGGGLTSNLFLWCADGSTWSPSPVGAYVNANGESVVYGTEAPGLMLQGALGLGDAANLFLAPTGTILQSDSFVRLEIDASHRLDLTSAGLAATDLPLSGVTIARASITDNWTFVETTNAPGVLTTNGNEIGVGTNTSGIEGGGEVTLTYGGTGTAGIATNGANDYTLTFTAPGAGGSATRTNWIDALAIGIGAETNYPTYSVRTNAAGAMPVLGWDKTVDNAWAGPIIITPGAAAITSYWHGYHSGTGTTYVVLRWRDSLNAWSTPYTSPVLTASGTLTNLDAHAVAVTQAWTVGTPIEMELLTLTNGTSSGYHYLRLWGWTP